MKKAKKQVKAVKPKTKISATQVLREVHDGVPVTELHAIRHRLDLICSCVIVVHHALTEQSDMLADDAALVLQRYVSDPLWIQILKLDKLLGHDVREDDIKEDEGGAS